MFTSSISPFGNSANMVKLFIWMLHILEGMGLITGVESTARVKLEDACPRAWSPASMQNKAGRMNRMYQQRIKIRSIAKATVLCKIKMAYEKWRHRFLFAQRYTRS